MEDVANQVAELHTRVAGVDKSKAAPALAEVEFERATQLVATNNIPRPEFDHRPATLVTARADLVQDLADVNQIRVSLCLKALPVESPDLGTVPSDLDQNFSAVREAQAALIESATKLGVLHSYNQTPQEMLAEFEKSGSGDVDRTFVRLAAEAPAVKQVEAKVEAARRDRAPAELDLRYCDIVAEIDGVVTRRNVNPGNNVQVGQALMAVRSLDEIWVDANVKETQLGDLRIDQPVAALHRRRLVGYGRRRLPMTGWLSAQLGRRSYFLLSIGVFTLASALCGMATSLDQPMLFRVIQGLAGGGLQPSGHGVLLAAFPREKQGTAMTLFGLAALLAPVVGPTLGGGGQFPPLAGGQLRRLLPHRLLCLCRALWRAVLYGASTSLPGLLQSLFGYDALNAGLVMSPGGLFALLSMPAIGLLLGRGTEARWLLVTGLLVMAAGNWWMSQMNLDISPGQVVWPRVLIVLGLSMCFAPANVAAYLCTPLELRGAAVGLLSLLRNEGGSFGTSMAQTLHERRDQFHTLRLGETLDPLNPAVTSFIEQAQGQLATGDPAAQQQLALQALETLRQQQDSALSYFDCFWIFAMVTLAFVLVVPLMKRSVAEKGARIVGE
jgi:MFS family permease